LKRPSIKRQDPSEHQLQTQLFKELDYKLKPGLIFRAIPNGGLRNARVAAGLAREGVRRGTPDTFVCLELGRVGWLEMKARRGKLTDEQIGFFAVVERLGHFWGVARSVDEALAHLARWGALRPEYSGGNSIAMGASQ
jgi:hypothetical protein